LSKSFTIQSAALLALAAGPLAASSHREAPFITELPQVDATDFYMFRSYEPGRDGFVTLIANYNPLQAPYGGPNYFALDQDAQYRINLDTSGDGEPDLVFQFEIDNDLADLQIPVGNEMVSIPLKNAGPITAEDQSLLNFRETYAVRLLRPGGAGGLLINRADGSTTFGKPMDNIGAKSFPDYAAYAASFVADAGIPGCGDGRVFVGQRRESFVVNLGETFDLVNYNPVGGTASQSSELEDANITTFALEVPVDCVRGSGDVVGGWTTARLPRRRTLKVAPSFENPESESASFAQVSRLGMPLVNEVVIGLKDKNRFNASSPKDDAQFATYVTNPTLPELLELLFGVAAPNNFPRQDLLAAFVTGIAGLNEFGFGEMQRLNLSIPPTARGAQSNLGVLGGDLAGFPNGRRPGDDVVDAELRVAMGVLCHAFPGAFGCGPEDAPSGTLPYTDGARQRASQFDDAFPYLRTPLAGSPQS
jgi:hypothetical protein